MQPSGAAAPRLDVAPEHLAFVRAAMASVANDAGGTANSNQKARLNLGDVKMAGKTGTAQAHSYGAGSRKMAHVAWSLKDHAWFIAFAPYDDPRYAISVLVEHGGFGADSAAPKAAELLRVALLKDPTSARASSPCQAAWAANRRRPADRTLRSMGPWHDRAQPRWQPKSRHGSREAGPGGLDALPAADRHRRGRRADAVLDRRRLVVAVGRRGT